MIVTDKQYYVDDNLIEKFNYCIKRQKKNFDHLFLVDGEVGYGKSTAVVGWAYYLAHATGKSFSVDNIFFDAEDMMDFASKTEQQVIIWDESASVGLAQDWQNEIQKKVIKILMMARKKRHFWFFVCPCFHRLNEYIVVDRAIGLLHIFSHDDMNRGQFTYYGKEKKNYMYYNIKKTKVRNYKKYTFVGRFVEKGFVIDSDLYEAKKDEAIAKIFASQKDTTSTKKDMAFSRLINLYQQQTGIDIVRLAEQIQYDRATINKIRNLMHKADAQKGVGRVGITTKLGSEPLPDAQPTGQEATNNTTADDPNDC